VLLETTVRLHGRGENAPYTGLNPAGLDEGGPIIPLAERALETGNAEELIQNYFQMLIYNAKK
jgi:hypothetical protein